MPAAIYFRAHDAIIHAQNPTEHSVFIAQLPVFKLARPFDPETLAQALRAALAASTKMVRHPDPKNWKAESAPILAAIGVRSWNALERASQLCAIEQTNALLTITPHRRGTGAGADRGFFPLTVSRSSSKRT